MLKKAILSFLAVCLILTNAPFMPAVHAQSDDPIIRVGLYYGSSALPAANLANETGSGYRFGFFDSQRSFVELGYTDVEKITLMKDKTMYLSGNTYYDTAVSGATKIGCYHIDSGETFDSFYDAAQSAESYRSDGVPAFPAYISGEYRVRIEHYSASEYAQSGISKLGLRGVSVVSPSTTCITVVSTATGEILFEFDCATSANLAVMPSRGETDRPLTWFKGYKYYGGFEYKRMSGNDVTVINFVSMQDYVKGVIPYEMSPSWPIEALKVQTLCAKTFALSNLNKYSSYGFDVNATVECQVYRGANTATATSDRAVDETCGEYIEYNGSYISAVYHSSNGGSTESAVNVWGTDYPYLRAVPDSFEDLSKASYGTWKFEITKSQLRQILIEKKYSPATVTDAFIEVYTPAGNVYKLTIVDSTGKKFSFQQERARTILNNTSVKVTTYSQRFSISPQISLYTRGSASTMLQSGLGGLYAIGSGGDVTPVSGSASSVYLRSRLSSSALSSSGSALVISGRGWGHNVGMSQWGARGMSEQGYTYDEIIKYYYTGVDIVSG